MQVKVLEHIYKAIIEWDKEVLDRLKNDCDSDNKELCDMLIDDLCMGDAFGDYEMGRWIVKPAKVEDTKVIIMFATDTPLKSKYEEFKSAYEMKSLRIGHINGAVHSYPQYCSNDEGEEELWDYYTETLTYYEPLVKI